MMFLLTPILWRPDQVPGRELFYLLNPFYYLVEIIREPLEGRAPSLFIWTVVLAVTAAGFVVSLLFFSPFRNRIVYWLSGRPWFPCTSRTSPSASPSTTRAAAR
jgi:ABC-type polysaccharide/polyol phosphate export permease